MTLNELLAELEAFGEENDRVQAMTAEAHAQPHPVVSIHARQISSGGR